VVIEVMRTVHLHLEEEQYQKLIKAKGSQNWINFVMQLTEK
jgi:hypothetical protein